MKRRIAILGSTGSIGTQALDVIARNREEFEVIALAAYSNGALLAQQAAQFAAKAAVLVAPPADFVPPGGTVQWAFGAEARDALCTRSDVDAVLVSVVGMAGLSAVLTCIQHRKTVLLANKETLMTAGDLVMTAARKAGVEIFPVDSEHTAIWQCLRGESERSVERLLLTASGGPFRTWTPEQIENATVEQALSHPNWRMGRKISIDSATMVNKCIEIVEAHHLFAVPPQRIEVVVHPQSIVHSAVAFQDGSVMAQMGVSDMRIPILYALSGGRRLDSGAAPLSLFDMPQLTFERCDTEKFPAVAMAYAAIEAGGNACCVLNAANEAAVAAFFAGQIAFGQIVKWIRLAMDRLFDPAPLLDYASVCACDEKTRRFCNEMIRN